MRKRKEVGSITIEAALILPMVMIVFIVFLTLMQGVYLHSKVQHALNNACLELSYDAYLLDSIGVLDGITEMSQRNIGNALSVAEVREFQEYLSDYETMEQIFTPISFNSPDEFYKSMGNLFANIDGLSQFVGRLASTFKAEGIYFMNRSIAKMYVDHAIGKYLKEIDVEVEVVHANVFTEDDSGIVIVEYPIQFPLAYIPFDKLILTNSSYVYSYSGDMEFRDTYHKAKAVSEYGKITDSSGGSTDQDGFAKYVYVVDNGRKYHKNSQCFHIHVNYIPIMYGLIKDTRTLCEHCCNGEEIDDATIVYYTLSGDVVHIDPLCHSIYHNVREMSEKEAIARGYLPCATCSMFPIDRKEKVK